MNQSELDQLRRGVPNEFHHLLGEIDEDGDLGIDEVEQEDTFRKSIQKVCETPAAPAPISDLVKLEVRDFVKDFSSSIPQPKPGPQVPGPASPTGRPTGVPHPVTPPSPKKSSTHAARLVSIWKSLKKSSNYEEVIQQSLESIQDRSMMTVLSALDSCSEGAVVTAVRKLDVGFA